MSDDDRGDLRRKLETDYDRTLRQHRKAEGSEASQAPKREDDPYEHLDPSDADMCRIVDSRAAKKEAAWMGDLHGGGAELSRAPSMTPVEYVANVRGCTLEQAGKWLAARVGVDANVIYIDPARPKDGAAVLLKRVFTHRKSGQPILMRIAGEWWLWRAGEWFTLADEDVDARIRNHFDHRYRTRVTRVDDIGVQRETSIAYKPKAPHPAQYSGYLKAMVNRNTIFGEGVPDLTSRWVCEKPAGYPDAAVCLVVDNGVLDLETLQLHPHHPGLFTPFKFHAKWVGEEHSTDEFDRFIETTFDHVPGQVDLLGEILGTSLVTENEFEKMLSLEGPTRSGKGTLVDLIEAAYKDGRGYGSWSTAAAGDKFGLMGVHSAAVLVVPDARLDPNADNAILAETLLKVTGGDRVRVDRKRISHISVRIPALVILVANEGGLCLKDPTGVLAGRSINIRTARSHFGHEDTTLKKRLRSGSLPALLSFMVRGYRRLRAQGVFTDTEIQEGEYLKLKVRMAPVKEFVERRCVLDHGSDTKVADFMTAFESFCAENGVEPVKPPKVLADINLHYPAAKVTRVKGASERVPDPSAVPTPADPNPTKTHRPYVFRGIGLRPEFDPSIETALDVQDGLIGGVGDPLSRDDIPF